MEDWRIGGLEDWRIGGLEDWRIIGLLNFWRIIGWNIFWLFLGLFFQFSKKSDAVPVSLSPRCRISGMHTERFNSWKKSEVAKR